MKCQKCGKEMEITKEDISRNPDNGKKYSRVVCVCKECDIWISVEVPKTS